METADVRNLNPEQLATSLLHLQLMTQNSRYSTALITHILRLRHYFFIVSKHYADDFRSSKTAMISIAPSSY